MTNETDFGRTETQTVALGAYQLDIVTDRGPRVLGVHRKGPSPLAVLPDDAIKHPAIGRYEFLGGHRLWAAPEVPAITYQPDSTDIAIEVDAERVAVTAQPDGAGIEKAIVVVPVGERLVVDHRLTNRFDTPLTVAPWAVTQLTPGGSAFIPLRGPGPADPFQADRSLVLWPYTDLSDSEVSIGPEIATINVTSTSDKFKLGIPNVGGWLAYSLSSWLFIKWAAPGVTSDIDGGATAQCYRDGRFVELETLGAPVRIESGESAHHREVWELLPIQGSDIDSILDALPVEPDEMHL